MAGPTGTEPYWLSENGWQAILPLLPRHRLSASREDDRRIISGILYMLRSNTRWQDCPSAYGPPTTVYNRWNRWCGRGLWPILFAAIAKASPADVAGIDPAAIRPQRVGTGMRRPRVPAPPPPAETEPAQTPNPATPSRVLTE
jgi:transposase